MLYFLPRGEDLYLLYELLLFYTNTRFDSKLSTYSSSNSNTTMQILGPILRTYRARDTKSQMFSLEPLSRTDGEK